MSQVLAGTILKQGAATMALPEKALSVKRFPFALLYNGSWAFREGRWIPALLTPALMPGVNAISQVKGQQPVAFAFAERVKGRSHIHRLVFNGAEGRLGDYKDFIHTYPVQTKEGLTRHYALIGEKYALTASGRVQRTIDKAWFQGLYDKLVESNIVLPMGYEDLLDHLAKLDNKLNKLSRRMELERDGHALSVLGEQFKKLKDLREEMEKGFEKQFPKAKAEYEATESQSLGASADEAEYIDPDETI